MNIRDKLIWLFPLIICAVLYSNYQSRDYAGFTKLLEYIDDNPVQVSKLYPKDWDKICIFDSFNQKAALVPSEVFAKHEINIETIYNDIPRHQGFSGNFAFALFSKGEPVTFVKLPRKIRVFNKTLDFGASPVVVRCIAREKALLKRSEHSSIHFVRKKDADD